MKNDMMFFFSESEDSESHSKFIYAMIKSIAGKFWDVKDKTILLNENGKPYFKDSDVKFNISHAGKVTVVYFCPSEVGIDIEKVKPMSKRLINKYYSDSEKGELVGLQEGSEQRTIKEVEIWTRKEAHCKCTGEGITRANLLWDSNQEDDYILSSICINEYVVTICIKKDSIN